MRRKLFVRTLHKLFVHRFHAFTLHLSPACFLSPVPLGDNPKKANHGNHNRSPYCWVRQDRFYGRPNEKRKKTQPRNSSADGRDYFRFGIDYLSVGRPADAEAMVAFVGRGRVPLQRSGVLFSALNALADSRNHPCGGKPSKQEGHPAPPTRQA